MRNFIDVKTDLEKPLNKELVKNRQQGSTTLHYLEGSNVIQLANEIFGYDAWNYEIIELASVCEREISKEDKYNNGAVKTGWEVGYRCIVKVEVVFEGDLITLRTDVGFGQGIDYNSLAAAHESAGKEAVTDALKRALRTFGDQFGNCLYMKEYRQEELGESKPSAAKSYSKPATTGSSAPTGDKITQPQIGFITKLAKEKGLKDLSAYTTKKLEDLTKKEAGDIITKLQIKE